MVIAGSSSPATTRSGCPARGQFTLQQFLLHQGGPAAKASHRKVEERLLPDKTSQGLYFSENEMHFVCPWHGYEYDMKRRMRLRPQGFKLRNTKLSRKGMRFMSSLRPLPQANPTPTAQSAARRQADADDACRQSTAGPASKAPMASSARPRPSDFAMEIERALASVGATCSAPGFEALMARCAKTYAAQVSR